MNCKELKNIIPYFLENELSENQMQDFNQHINSCENCNKLFRKVKKTNELLMPRAEVESQAYYYTRLKQKMENKYEPKKSIVIKLLSRKFVQPMIYLSSLIIAVYIGILIGSGTSPNGNNQFSGLNDDESSLKTFIEYQYLNDFEIETIENLFIDEDSLSQ